MEGSVEELLRRMVDAQSTASSALNALQLRDGTSQSRIPPLPEYDGRSESGFREFEFRVKQKLGSGNYPTLKAIRAVMGCFSGSAAQVAQSMEAKLIASPTIDGFFLELRKIFLSPSNQENAKLQFERKTQSKDSVRGYHSALGALHRETFPDNFGQLQTGLINHFIAGLNDDEIRLKLRDLSVTGQFPKTYEDALALTLAFSAQKDIVSMEKHRLKNSKRMNFNTETEDDNMDCSMVEPPKCRIHPLSKHTDAQCNAQKTPGFIPKAPNFTPKTSGFKRGCFNCGDLSHIKS